MVIGVMDEKVEEPHQISDVGERIKSNNVEIFNKFQESYGFLLQLVPI